MGRTTGGASNLRKQIESWKKRKKEIYDYAKKLEALYEQEKISLEEYRKKANEKLKGYTIQQWFDYYTDSIRWAERRINRKRKKKKNVFVGAVVGFVFAFLFFYSGIQLVGHLVEQSNVDDSLQENTPEPGEDLPTSEQDNQGENAPGEEDIQDPLTSEQDNQGEGEAQTSYSENITEEVSQNETSPFQEEPSLL